MTARFDQLPVIESLDLRHAWGVFGEADNLGTLNHLTPERVIAAAQLVRTGEVVNLSLPMSEPDPPMFGRDRVRHEIFTVDRNVIDERLDSFYPQGSSQWDGLRHIRCREHGYYGGYTGPMEPGAGRLGIEHWVEHGFVGRGVLLDVVGYLASREETLDPFATRTIEAEELVATAAWQGIEVAAGDILCIRFGWVDAYLRLPPEQREPASGSFAFPGLSGAESMARLLWDWGVAAVACDNPSVEVLPMDPKIGSLHRRLIPLLGMALGELFDFGRLAEACRDQLRSDFLFVSVPLHVLGAVGSPANAIAIL